MSKVDKQTDLILHQALSALNYSQAERAIIFSSGRYCINCQEPVVAPEPFVKINDSRCMTCNTLGANKKENKNHE